MNMPKIAIGIGTLLGLVGIAGAVLASQHGKSIWTALIPLYVGVIFEALGVASLALPHLRKHLMHALAALALLGTVLPLARLATAINKPNASTAALATQAAMALLCAVTVALCVKSFGDARKAREAGELPAA